MNRTFAVVDWNATSRRSELNERPVKRFSAVNTATVDVPEGAVLDLFYHLTDAVQSADILNRDHQ